MREEQLSSLQWGNWGTEKLNNLSKITQLLNLSMVPNVILETLSDNHSVIK